MKKRILCFTLALSLIIATTLVPVKETNAMGFTGIEQGIMGVGSALGGPQALGLGLLLGGVCIGVDYLEEHWTEIEVAISTKANDFGIWLENAKNRVIDTTSDVWDAVVEWGIEAVESAKEWIEGINPPAVEGVPQIIVGDYNFYQSGLSAGPTYSYYSIVGATQPYSSFIYEYASGKADYYIVSLECLKYTYVSGNNSTGPYNFSKVGLSALQNLEFPIYSVNIPRKTAYPYLDLENTITVNDLGLGYQLCYDEILNNIINVGSDSWAEALGYPRENLKEGEELGVVGVGGTGVISIPQEIDISDLLERVYANELEYAQALEMVGAQQVVIEKESSITYPIENGVVLDTPLPTPPVSDAEFEVHGLDDIFPFCIPFDLYNLLDTLSASPEAPKFSWNIPYKGNHMIEIDLSPFNEVASLFRSMQIVAFCIGLAFKSRDLIGG